MTLGDPAALATQVSALAAALRRRGERLAVAESCTGGMLAAALTAAPGASDWFRGGVVAYANDVKIDLLDVSERVLLRHGAVSAETAAAMARGVRRRCGADYGLSITGIAGPGGATPGKPVGRVFVGLSGPPGETVDALSLSGDRSAIRRAACRKALERLQHAVAAAPDPRP